MDISTGILTFGIGFIASFMGAMVGSGGLISIPFLIFIGLPPHVAIATNRLGSLGLEIGSLARFIKSKAIMWKYVLVFCLLAVVGAYVGTNILIETNDNLVKNIVAGVMILFLPVILFKKSVGVENHTPSKLKSILGYILLAIAFAWSAFFAGGSATIIFYILMYLFGFTIIQAGATLRLPGFCVSVVSLFIFAGNGLVHWQYGFILFFAMIVGGYAGAHTALKKGNAWVKILFAIVVAVSALILLLK